MIAFSFHTCFLKRVAGCFFIASTFQLVHATDLLEAYQLAKASDPTLQAAQYAMEGVRQRIPQARAALLPSIDMVGNKGSTKAETTFTNVPTVDRKMDAWAWTLQLKQPLIKASAIYGYQQSQHVFEQAEAQYEQVEQDFILRLVQAYFGLGSAHEVLSAADAEVRALTEQLEQVSRGFRSGTHSLMDVDDTKSRLGLARSRSISAKNDMENKRAELEKMTGQRIENVALLKPVVLLPAPQPDDSHAWIGQARLHHPAVRAQRAALLAAQTDIRRNRAEYAPTLDLVASRSNNYSSNNLTALNEYATRSNATQVGIQLNIPIFSGGATNARVKEAIANSHKTESDLESAIRQAATDAQQAFIGVMNGLAQVEALQFAQESGLRAVKGNRLGYEVGMRINLDVLNSEQQLFVARRDLASARYETLLQGLRLKAATGMLKAEDLMAVNDLLLD